MGQVWQRMLPYKSQMKGLYLKNGDIRILQLFLSFPVKQVYNKETKSVEEIKK